MKDADAPCSFFSFRPEGVWPLGFAEPANALSLPTWVIHVSSLLEWLVAMGLVWRLGIASGNRTWQGLTWCMSERAPPRVQPLLHPPTPRATRVEAPSPQHTLG